MIDTHAHLDMSIFDEDIEEVISNYLKVGIEKVITIGVNKKSTTRAKALSLMHNSVFYSAGYHPLEDIEDISYIETFLDDPRCIGVGECGIDLHYKQDLEIQVPLFLQQIELAIKHDLPLIIHSRDAFKETYEILSKYKGRIRGVMHCFAYGVEEAMKILDLGLYLGFDGPVTFKNADTLRKVVEFTPLDRILLETDSPYLTPVPHRGKRNEPQYVKYVYNAVSVIKNISVERLSDIIKESFLDLFCRR